MSNEWVSFNEDGEFQEAVSDEEIEAQRRSDPGVYARLAELAPNTLVTEEALARWLYKCVASIKAAVERGELPQPARLMGKNTWTVGAIIRHIEASIEAETRKFSRLRP